MDSLKAIPSKSTLHCTIKYMYRIQPGTEVEETGAEVAVCLCDFAKVFCLSAMNAIG